MFLFEIFARMLGDISYAWSHSDYGAAIMLSALFAVFIATILMVVGMIIMLIHYMIDTSGPAYTARGLITDKSYVPAHTTMTQVGKVMVPIYHPNRWYVTAQVKGNAESIQVSKKLYDAAMRGSESNFRVTTGRLSKRTRILDFATYAPGAFHGQNS